MKFALDEAQVAKINEWVSGHNLVYEGASGGRYTYSFTPTSLGIVYEVIDNVTGEKLNVTDYDLW